MIFYIIFTCKLVRVRGSSCPRQLTLEFIPPSTSLYCSILCLSFFQSLSFSLSLSLSRFLFLFLLLPISSLRQLLRRRRARVSVQRLQPSCVSPPHRPSYCPRPPSTYSSETRSETVTKCSPSIFLNEIPPITYFSILDRPIVMNFLSDEFMFYRKLFRAVLDMTSR